MRPRHFLFRMALAGLALAGPTAVADEARFTPQPPPTARPIHATPAAPPREGPPLRPMAAFAPLPGGGSPSDPAPDPVRQPTEPPPKLEPPRTEPPKPEPAPAPPPVTAPAPEPVPPPVAPARASDAQTVAAPLHRPPRKPPVPSAAKRVWATEPVYVRAAPDPRARIVDGLVAGDALDRLGVAEDGWVRVGRDGREIGYVAGRFLATAPPKPDNGDGTCALPDDLPDRAGPVAAVGTVLRALAAVNLRAAPACDARVLDVLEAGATVTVTGHADGWYEVRGRDLPRGFVGARLLGR